MIKRRLYMEERVSPLARWSFRLVLFSIPVIVLAVGLYRIGALDYQPALVVLACGLGLALLAGLMGVIAFFIVWESGWIGIGRAMAAVAVALLVLVGPAAVIARGVMLPPVADISTDLRDPPRFRALLLAHARAANTRSTPGGLDQEAQREAYPGVKPADLAASPEEAFNAVLAVVRRYGWHILDATPPRGAQRDGHIEAVAVSQLTGYRNDVVLRIRATARGTRVDMRAASRYGRRDLGSNAMQIEGLMVDLAAERRKH